jgi:4'-phosphopantetheinyl transferase
LIAHPLNGPGSASVEGGSGRERNVDTESVACLIGSEPWHAAPEVLTLGPTEVHVWRTHLYQPDAAVRRLYNQLAADEQDRAQRFVFGRDRDQFVITRGTLRRILAGYLQTETNHVRFSYDRHGKPAVVGDALRFNASHSRGLALIAVTRSRRVGIDVEYMQPQLEVESLAERFFSPDERAALRALLPAGRRRAFFDCWTRKEAYVKARGDGLSLALDQFTVSLTVGEARLVHTAVDSDEASRWWLHEIRAGAGYAACLAVEGHPSCVQFWRATGVGG